MLKPKREKGYNTVIVKIFNINYEANGRIRTVGEWRVPITNGIMWAQGVSYSWVHFVFHYPDKEG